MFFIWNFPPSVSLFSTTFIFPVDLPSTWKPSSTLPEQMKQLYADAISNQLASVFDNSKAAYAFLLDLADYALENPALSSPRVTLAKNYLDSNYYNTDLNLDEVADAVGLSKYHLCREFNHLYGISPGKYLANLRLQKSCALLLQSHQHTIAEIASMVGFSNDNYFWQSLSKSLRNYTNSISASKSEL